MLIAECLQKINTSFKQTQFSWLIFSHFKEFFTERLKLARQTMGNRPNGETKRGWKRSKADTYIYIFINISEGTAFLLQGLIITYNVKQYVIPLRRKAVPSEILIKKKKKYIYIYICIPYCKISLASFVYIFTYCWLDLLLGFGSSFL